jgi:hypothetical protein
MDVDGAAGDVRPGPQVPGLFNGLATALQEVEVSGLTFAREIYNGQVWRKSFIWGLPLLQLCGKLSGAILKDRNGNVVACRCDGHGVARLENGHVVIGVGPAPYTVSLEVAAQLYTSILPQIGGAEFTVKGMPCSVEYAALHADSPNVAYFAVHAADGCFYTFPGEISGMLGVEWRSATCLSPVMGLPEMIALVNEAGSRRPNLSADTETSRDIDLVLSTCTRFHDTEGRGENRHLKAVDLISFAYALAGIEGDPNLATMGIGHQHGYRGRRGETDALVVLADALDAILEAWRNHVGWTYLELIQGVALTDGPPIMRDASSDVTLEAWRVLG